MNYTKRRDAFLAAIDRPVVLFAGGEVSRNYPANPYPYRADGNFLYFFDSPEPGSAALFDPQEKTVTLFLPARTVADALWHGAQSSFDAMRERHRVHAVLPVEELEAQAARLLKGRQADSVAVADWKAAQRARALTGQELVFDDPTRCARADVIKALAALRLRKDAEELAVMRRTALVTREAHVLAMRHSKPGVSEQLLAGYVEGTFAQHGCTSAYGTILSVRGEVLHNHAHGNTLKAGDVVLLDAGAEDASGLCSDVTRCWPVGGPFTPEGRDVYELVLASELAAVAAVKPGARFRDLHLLSSRVITEGLLAMGLLKGKADALVEAGAHALFFPHGLGHQLGLDVHDLETFGDQVLYAPGRKRSEQFGLAYLRMDLDLAPGMTFTIEPGVYFVPAILRSPELREKFAGQVNFDRAEQFLAMNGGRGFGGVRIEDNVLCTESGGENLTQAIPKGRSELEALVGTA
jgi:Xaa-Pro aminopeptidase